MSLSSILDHLAAQPPISRRKKRLRPARFFIERLEQRALLTSDASLADPLNAADTASGPSDNQKFVDQAYHDLLGRAADAGGLAFWVAQVDAGAPQGQIADALTHSAEYYSTVVDPAYQKYLGRLPDSGGLNYWISQMQSGLTDEHLEAGFIGSTEFYVHSGGSDANWVDAMYADLLGRPADAQGQAYWVGQLASGVSRTAVAYGFADSLERERQRVEGDYQHYLHRTADQNGLDFWVDQFAQGLTNEDLIAGFVGSPEYYARAAKGKIALSAQLADDTGASASDGVTSDPRITGKLTAATTLTSFDAVVGDTQTDLTGLLGTDGSFSLGSDEIASLFGFAPSSSGAGDGPHALTLEAGDAAGNTSSVDVAFTLDTIAPNVNFAGPPGAQTINHNLSIVGQATDATSGVAALAAAIDGGAYSSVSFDSSGNFSYTTALALDGTADGEHTIHFKATDEAGNVSAASDFALTILTAPPTITAFDLSPGSQSGTPGSHATDAARVNLVGQTEPGVQVTLVGTGLTALASGSGAFEFPNVTLAAGDNAFTAQSTDVAGNTATFPLTVHYTPPSGGQTDPVIAWNQTALDAIRQDATDPNLASRGLAMVQSAVFDAVNAAEQKPGRFVTFSAPADSSPAAAVDRAAHDVLAYLYPAQQATFDAELAATLSDVPDGQSKTDGIAAGQQAAAAMIALRADDGWNNYVDYTPGSGPGVWAPTPPNYRQALEPQWATLTPWAMTFDSQFRPAGPPDLTSQAWADALNQVQSLGSATSTTRTADQTEIAHFWADTNGTATPPGHWNEIADQIASSEGNSLDADAQLFAELDVGLADAAVVAWDAKFAYNAWRPVTAIPDAASTGNPNVTPDPNWQPMLITPNFPEYVSGHSTFSGTAAGILDAVFGANTSFSAPSDALPGVTRSFDGFDAAAEEAGMSRIYAGIHFLFSDLDGLAAGHSLADYVLSTFDTSEDSVPPKVAITSPQQSSAANGQVTVTGQATDNLSGVQSLTAAVDDGNPVPLTFDASGNFTFTTTLPLDGSADGPHVIHFQAADFAGNFSIPTDLNFTLETNPPAIDLTSPTDGATIDGATQLTGTVTSASNIVALDYDFDGGAALPFPLAADGGFAHALDLSTLSAGDHTLTVTATSAAGHTSQDSITVHLAAAIPLTVSSLLPVEGGSDVGVTYRPRIDFSRAIDASTLTSADFYATDSTGAVIPSSIVPSQDGTFAWLFFANPLPGASTITITVDGSQIKDAAGNLLDADDSGTPGSVLTSNFTTVNVAGQPDTTVYTSLDQTQPSVAAGASLTGIVADPGPDLQPGSKDDVAAGPDGVLATADDVYKLPIAGVKVYIIGHEDQAVYTDSSGRFTFTNVPTGDVKLVLDGTTVTDSGGTPLIDKAGGFYFPEMVMDLTDIKPGVVNTVMGNMGTPEEQAARAAVPGVYLPRIPESILQPVSDTQVTHITVDAAAAPELTPAQRQYLSLDVQPGSLIGFDGQPLTSARIGISTVPPSLVNDMLPSGVLQHSFDITIQAPGVAVFTTPAVLTMPNLLGDAPGTQTEFLSFDHTTGRLLFEGTMTVSADGLYLRSDPGEGVTHAGWHSDAPPGNNKSAPPPPKPPGPCDNPQQMQEMEKKLEQCIQAATDEAKRERAVFYENIEFEEEDAKDAEDSYNLTVSNLANFEPDLDGAKSEQAQVQDALDNPIFATVTVALENYITAVRFQIQWEQHVGDDDLQEIIALADEETDIKNKLDEHFQDPNKDFFFTLSQFLQLLQTQTIPELQQEIDGEKQDLKFYANEVRQDNNEIVDDKSQLAQIDKDEQAAILACDEKYLCVEPGDSGGMPQGQMGAPNSTMAPMMLVASDTTTDTVTQIENLVDQYVALLDPYLIAGTTPPDDVAAQAQQLQDSAAALAGGDVASFLKADILQSETTDANQGMPLWNADGDAPPYPIFYSATISNGPQQFEVRGMTAAYGQYSVFVGAGETLESVSFYDPRTNEYGISFPFLSPGAPYALPRPTLGPIDPSLADSDGDGLVDLAEDVVGTDPHKYSTAGDGISDLAAVQEGLNPLGNYPVNTGLVASLSLNGEAQAVTLAGSTVNAQQQIAYVATGTYGLAIVDASQFTKPMLLGQLPLPGGDATSVSVDTNLEVAAVADGAGGLDMIDVSNPAAPRLLQSIAADATQVVALDGIAYAAVGSELRSYDMLTGDRIQVLSLGGGNLTSLAYDGTFIYTLDDKNTLRIVDISQPQVAERGSLTLPYGGGLFAGGGTAYVSVPRVLVAPNYEGGYETVDVSDPDHPQLLGGLGPYTLAGQAVAANGSGVVLTVGNAGPRGPGLEVYNGSDPTNTTNFVTRFNLPALPNGLAIGAGLAFVADGSAGLQVVNYLPFDTGGVPPTVTLDTSNLTPDPTLGGFDAVEGSLLTLKAAVSDDVQVRNVELLVNGQVVANSVSFPFELSAYLPTIASAGSGIALEISATDTGGNTTVTSPVTINLVRDATPPTIVRQNPPDGGAISQHFRALTVDFSKPLDPATVSAADFEIDGPAGAIVAQAVELRYRDGEVQITFPAGDLPVGDYTLVIHAALIADTAGNLLGSADLTSTFHVAQYSDVWINPNGGKWSDPTNWDSGRVPGAGDVVLIDQPGNPTITFDSSAGTVDIRSLLSKDPFKVAGGTLIADQSIEVDNTFTLAGGTIRDSLILPGVGGNAIATGGTLDGMTLDADLSLADSTTLTVKDGLTLNGTLTLKHSAYYQYTLVNFSGAQTLDGAGTVRFVNSFVGYGNNGLQPVDGGTLTIGPGITLHGQGAVVGNPSLPLINEGTVDADASGQTISIIGSSVTNSGTLAADSGGALNVSDLTGNANTLTLAGTGSSITLNGTNYVVNQSLTVPTGATATFKGTWTVAAGSTLSTAGGALGLGDPSSTSTNAWTNAGTIDASAAGTVKLGGKFTLADLGSFTTSADSNVDLVGTLDLSPGGVADTLALDATSGAWNLSGGVILGGTVTASGGAALGMTASSALDGMTLDADLSLADSTTLTVKDGLTLNGTLTLKHSAYLQYTLVNFSGTQTLDGAGTVRFVNSYGYGNNGLQPVDGGTLTIGPGITLHGQ
ncbi:MAG TPA: DUF4214 domain-containing protein, partial [Pirellulales bacterium]|nr:DUF4214 domain-containing protein [Pirellulales bacterium]